MEKRNTEREITEKRHKEKKKDTKYTEKGQIWKKSKYKKQIT